MHVRLRGCVHVSTAYVAEEGGGLLKQVRWYGACAHCGGLAVWHGAGVSYAATMSWPTASPRSMGWSCVGTAGRTVVLSARLLALTARPAVPTADLVAPTAAARRARLAIKRGE